VSPLEVDRRGPGPCCKAHREVPWLSEWKWASSPLHLARPPSSRASCCWTIRGAQWRGERRSITAPAQGGSRNDVPAVPKLEVEQQGEQDELLHTSSEVGKPSGYLLFWAIREGRGAMSESPPWHQKLERPAGRRTSSLATNKRK
jgi:hypothetical protein